MDCWISKWNGDESLHTTSCNWVPRMPKLRSPASVENPASSGDLSFKPEVHNNNDNDDNNNNNDNSNNGDLHSAFTKISTTRFTITLYK